MADDGRSEVAVGADVDVRALMAEVHAEVERKKQAGLYPPEVLEELDLIGAGTADDALTRAVLGLRHGVSFDTTVPTASRVPVMAPVAASFKRAVRSSVRWYVSAVVQQIEQFGANVIHVLNLVADRLRGIEERAEERSVEHDRALSEIGRVLEERLTEMRAAVTENRSAIDASREEAAAAAMRAATRLDALEAEVASARARDRLAMLERAVRSLEGRTGRAPGTKETTTSAADRSRAADSAIDYFDFEAHFRGSEEEIRARQALYIEHYENAPGPVVDVGCGRGEFLELLRDAGISSYGIDRHPQMIARCEEKGLDAREGDALEHLASVSAGSLGGVFSAQMVEHLPVSDVPRLFELAADALAPEGRLVVETINPGSLAVFAGAFYLDLGHLRPLHPLTLRFLAEKAGFREVRVEYSALPPEEERPSEIEPTGDAHIDRVVQAVNENFRRVDRLVFGPQDYAIVATR